MDWIVMLSLLVWAVCIPLVMWSNSRGRKKDRELIESQNRLIKALEGSRSVPD